MGGVQWYIFAFILEFSATHPFALAAGRLYRVVEAFCCAGLAGMCLEVGTES